jgi:hypothetical protein
MRNNVSASPLGIRPDTDEGGEEEGLDNEGGEEHVPTVVGTTTAVAVSGDYIIDSNNNNNIDFIPPPQAADNEGTVLLDVVLESVAIGNNINIPPRVMMDNRLVVPPSLQQHHQQQQQQQRLQGATTTTATRVTAHPAAGRLLRAPHRIAASSTTNNTTTTSSSLRSSHPHHHRQAPNGKSNKQHPSHRKVRRWDNDNFIGHPVAETTHLQLLHESSEDGGNWKEYYMPNYPTYYRSSFAKLIHDTSDVGKVVRDKFYKGEVASSVVGRGTTMGSGGMHLGGRNIKCNAITMTDCITYRMRKLGLSSSLLLLHKQQQQEVEKTKKQREDVGRILYQQLLTSRIQSVLVQSCGGISIFENNSSSSNMNEARATVSAFERYLVSLALVGNNTTTTTQDDNKTMMTRSSSCSDCNGDNVDSIVVAGDFYPPIQSNEVYDVFHKVLSRPPKIVFKSTTIIPSTSTITSSSSSSSMTACWIPTVHFYFSTDTTTSTVVDVGGRSSAFHRILLYSVCQFHGLVVSSSIIDNSISSRGGSGGTKKTNTTTNKRQGEKEEVGKKKNRCIEKVVTIQAGVMLAPTLRLLDYVI